jgi:hypothetical protein
VLPATIPCASALIPCDVIDFIQLWPQLKDNLALAVLVAWIKVPYARARFLSAIKSHLAQTQGDVRELTGQGLFHGFDHAIRLETCRSEKETEEAKLLGRAGGMRKLGLAACCRALGIGEPLPPTQVSKSTLAPSQGQARQRIPFKTRARGVPDVVAIGTSLRHYAIHRRFDKLDTIAALGRNLQPACEFGPSDTASFLQFVHLADSIVCKIGVILGNTLKDGCYTRCFLVRCLVLGFLSSTKDQIDWSQISMGTIRLASADETDVLGVFDSNWSASELSEFCFHRSDWAIFVPMFGCLWKEVFDTFKQEVDVMETVRSAKFVELATAHVERWGFASHPWCLVRQCVQ